MTDHDGGSDARLARIADTSELERGARLERARRAFEEWYVSLTPPARVEPGESYPDPDVAPPAEQAHPEFDPIPAPIT